MKEVDILKERAETDFITTLLDFNYIADDAQLKHLVQKTAMIAHKLPAYSSWPLDRKQFWDAEALCWNGRIEKEVRDFIRGELSFLQGNNLDLGSGTVCYVPNSTAVDFSEEMLHINPAQNKVIADLNKKLPFDDESFDSVTMVFVVHYVEDVPQLLCNVHRVLRLGGHAVIVQSASVLGLHRIHYKNALGEAEMRMLMKSAGFRVQSYEELVNGKKLLFLIGEKTV